MVHVDELSDTEGGSPPIIPEQYEKEQTKVSEEESQLESSSTLMDSELELQQEEGRKREYLSNGKQAARRRWQMIK